MGTKNDADDGDDPLRKWRRRC